MKKKPRKLSLNRETVRSLDERSLGRVAGGYTWWECTSFHTCSDVCDTDYECSGGCDQPTNLWYAC